MFRCFKAMLNNTIQFYQCMGLLGVVATAEAVLFSATTNMLADGEIDSDGIISDF